MIAGSLETMVKLPVSRPVVAGVVTLTGVAPFLYVQLLPWSGPAALLVAAFLIRRFAIDRFSPVRLRLSRWLNAAVAVGVAGLALTVSFGVTHPLWATNAYTDDDGHIYVQLHNAGLATVTVLGLSEPARLQSPFAPPHPRRHVEGAVIAGHSSRAIVLLRRGCGPRDVRVRYRIFSRVMTARLRARPSNLDC